jgi:hypothetical protein
VVLDSLAHRHDRWFFFSYGGIEFDYPLARIQVGPVTSEARQMGRDPSTRDSQFQPAAFLEPLEQRTLFSTFISDSSTSSGSTLFIGGGRQQHLADGISALDP